jgi:hypothetical protein
LKTGATDLGVCNVSGNSHLWTVPHSSLLNIEMKISLDKILKIIFEESHGEVYRHEYSYCVAALYSALFAVSMEICIGQNFVKDIFISEIIRE